jgi:DNA-binding transcriptional regulator LsrR (DeoR family)
MARSKNKIDLRLLTKVSKFYYEDGFNQDEIVARLHISRSTISRFLQQARDEGIVKIIIVPPIGTYADLERKIEQKYQIEEALVTNVESSDSPQMISRELGAAAASYMMRVLEQNDVVGMSWGYTIRGMVSALEPRSYPNVQILQMTGGIGKPESEVYATELCRKMASRLSCKLVLLPTPGIVSSKQMVEVYLRDEYVQAAMKLLPKISLAFVGIGSLGSYSIAERDETILTQGDINEVSGNGAVGDIALRFINDQGQLVRSDLDKRVIGIDLDHLKKIPRVVGVAGGIDKFRSIKAALRGGLIDVLITDQITAKALSNDD